MKNLREKCASPAFTSFLASISTIIIGLLFGYALLFALNAPNANTGMVAMLTNGFTSSNSFAKVLYQAAPLMMCGLSVGFAFKTGLFNIGAPGQYTMGAFVAILLATQFQMPWWICLLGAMVGGAVWGLFPGLFKALFNVNEVITSIMFNWIGMYLVNLIFANMPKTLANYWGSTNSDRTADLAKANPDAMIPKMGLDQLFDSTYMNISIFIAIGMAIVMYIVVNKTTFGYELKACGLNKNASQYAGINANRNIVLSMVIAGALSGIGGGLYYLAGTGQYVLEKAILARGFDGIPVALLANSNPVGTIFSALFVSYLSVGGSAMQPHFSTETVNIIISVIIYLAAFGLLMRNMLTKVMKKKEEGKK